MNYYGAKDLAASFRTVRNNTIKIAEEIDESKYDLRATPETRSVREYLIHIAHLTDLPYELHGVQKRTALAGFDYMGFIGPRIVRRLVADAHQVTVFHRGEHDAPLPPGVTSIRRPDAAMPVRRIPDEVRQTEPDVVLHMIAMGEEDAQLQQAHA